MEITADTIDAIFIIAYTRAQALADGVLVDVSSTAKEAGIRFPVAVTSALWNDINAIPAKSAQDLAGRLWDVLWMFRLAARNFHGSELQYELFMQVGRKKRYRIKAHVGAGDNGEGVVTLMLPDED